MFRRLTVALAFAACCFLPTWISLAEGDQLYFARFSPVGTVMLPVAVLTALLALALFLAAGIRSWRESRWGQRAFLLASLVPLGAAAVAGLRALPFDVNPLVGARWFWPAALALGVVPASLALRRPAYASRIAAGVFLYSCPVLILVAAQAARQTWRFPASDYRDRPPAPAVRSGEQPRRVVWIVFDEMSEDVAFRRRPASVRLPALDALRSRSLFATAAHSPADATLTSMPALILGRHVAGAAAKGPRELSLTFDDGTQADWSAAPNVFDAARAMGYDTAVVGWYHPYGRVLSRSLTRCWWAASWLSPGIEEPGHPVALGEALARRLRLEIAMFPGIAHLPGADPELLARQAQVERLSDLIPRAVAVAADPTVGLALLHLPAPHPPAVFDRATGRFTAERTFSYLDGLACADDILRRVREALDRGGLTGRTVLLVSADHGWRAGFWRGRNVWTREDDAIPPGDRLAVPFLLHFPGEDGPLEYRAPFGAVASRSIVEAVLAGRIRDAAEASRFLDNRIRSGR